jgi:hypothetical protein
LYERLHIWGEAVPGERGSGVCDARVVSSLGFVDDLSDTSDVRAGRDLRVL